MALDPADVAALETLTELVVADLTGVTELAGAIPGQALKRVLLNSLGNWVQATYAAGFTAAGSGSTPMTMQDKARQRINVRDKGANTAASATVNTAAILASIDLCVLTGAVCHFDEVYTINDNIPLPVGVCVSGPGGVQQTVIDKNCFVLAGRNALRDVQIIHYLTDTMTDVFNNCGVKAGVVYDITIERCTFSKFYGCPIMLLGAANYTIFNNTFKDNHWKQTGPNAGSFAICSDITQYSSGSATPEQFTGGRAIITHNFILSDMSQAINLNPIAGDQDSICAFNHIVPCDPVTGVALTSLVGPNAIKARHGIELNYGGGVSSRKTKVLIFGNNIQYKCWAGVYCQTGDGINTGAIDVSHNYTYKTGLDDSQALGGGIRTSCGTAGHITVDTNQCLDHMSVLSGAIHHVTSTDNVAQGRYSATNNTISDALGHGFWASSFGYNYNFSDNNITNSGLNSIRLEHAAGTYVGKVKVFNNDITHTNVLYNAVLIACTSATPNVFEFYGNKFRGVNKTTATAANVAIWALNSNVQSVNIHDNSFEQFYACFGINTYMPAGRYVDRYIVDSNDYIDVAYCVNMSSGGNDALMIVSGRNKFSFPSAVGAMPIVSGTALLAGSPMVLEGERTSRDTVKVYGPRATLWRGTWLQGDEVKYSDSTTLLAMGKECTVAGLYATATWRDQAALL